MKYAKQIIAALLICSYLVLKGQDPKHEPINIEQNPIREERKVGIGNDGTKKKFNQKTIEAVYNQYIQDGNNSAVTGGIGTEKLIVYGPSLRVRSDRDKFYTQLQGGVDIISSASTDNINFVCSSPSRIDYRVHVNGDYGRHIEKSKLTVDGGMGLSIESDYFSWKTAVGLTKRNKNEHRTYSVQFQFFDDDLSWGLITPGTWKRVGLVYPSELRYMEWFDITHRHTYVLKLGYSQILNKRNVLGLFVDLTQQEGLLSTPFHRIFFASWDIAVENLPRKRRKTSVLLRLNSFVGGRVILKNAINPYTDDFGIRAIAFDNETIIKLKPELMLLANFRWYTQTASQYFKGHLEHDRHDEFYTSDYDLSAFETYTLGAGIRKHYDKNVDKRTLLKTMMLRYNFMYRTNGLHAHMLSTSFILDRHPK